MPNHIAPFTHRSLFLLYCRSQSPAVMLRVMSGCCFCFLLSREKIPLDTDSAHFMCLVSGRCSFTNSLIHCEFCYFLCWYFKPWMDTEFCQMRSQGNYDKDHEIFPHYSSETMSMLIDFKCWALSTFQNKIHLNHDALFCFFLIFYWWL